MALPKRRGGVVLVAGLAFVLWSWLDGEAQSRWGWLGVRIRDLSEREMEEISARHGIREGFGALIVEVLKETPAEDSGLKAGDIVVAVRDHPITDTRMLQRVIASAGIDEMVWLTVLRPEEGRRRVNARLASMPATVEADRVAAEYGFMIRDPEAQPERGAPAPTAVPSVAAVLSGSRAARAGLQVGDVIVEVSGRHVVTVQAVREALLAAGPDGPLPLVVRRDRERVFLSLEAERLP